MKKKIILNLCDRGKYWFSACTPSIEVYGKGFAFNGNIFLENQSFVTWLLKILTDFSAEKDFVEKLIQVLQGLNGNFALVVKTDKILFAAVDRVRSIPLFYGVDGNNVVISDDANYVRGQNADAELDSLSVKEFMLTGYVTGPDTLFRQVKQMQAGECLWYVFLDSNAGITTHRYYRWIHENYFSGTKDDLFEEMDRMHVRSFERLLESTKGRTLVVPLSGGYDSRLVVAMLKRLGRKNVICFSYGKPGNWESEISKHIADTLGYPWFFVPYTRRKWREWFRSQEIADYHHYSSGLNSLAHVQDWPALWNLKKTFQIPNDAIIVPGHTGDFISGGHIPLKWKDEESQTGLDKLLKSIWEKHYVKWKVESHDLNDLFRHKNILALDGLQWNSMVDMAGAFESWEWQERQSKFIVNSVRVYEFWNYDWRMPMWDNDFMDYWAKIPLEHRFGKSLYDLFVKRLFAEMKVDFERIQHNDIGRYISNRYISKGMDLCLDPRLGCFTFADALLCYRFYSAIYPARGLASITKLTEINTLGCWSILERIKKWT